MSRYENQKRGNKLIPIIIVIILLLIGAYFWLQGGDKETIDKNIDGSLTTNQVISLPTKENLSALNKNTATTADKRTADENNATLSPDEESATAQLESLQSVDPANLTLDQSDDVFQQAIGEVSPNLSEWFNTDNAIKKYIVLVHDLSQNQLLAKHKKFLGIPKGEMVGTDNQGLYLTKEGYQRYDHFAHAIVSIDTQKGLSLYQFFKPLFDKVYQIFSYPASYKVEDIFLKAAANIIKAPVIEGRVKLTKHSLLYRYTDKKLEALNAVEKQMLRMGPENTKKIQLKLRELVESLATLEE